MKKTLFLIGASLVLLLFLTSCGSKNKFKPTLVCDPAALSSEYFLYEIDNNEVTITGIKTNYPSSIILPDAIEGYPVTKIGYAAFKYSDIVNLTIPDSVTELDRFCFAYSTINSITLSKNITTIPEYAFYYSELANIDFQSGVTKIENSSFRRCIELTSLTIPSQITDMGKYTFAECYNLTDVTINSNITELPTGTFLDCSELRNVTLPNSLVKIGNRAFNNCPEITEFTLSENITEIGCGAFANTALTKITFNSKIEIINDEAFYGTKLTELVIPNTVTYIGFNCLGGIVDYDEDYDEDIAILKSLSVPFIGDGGANRFLGYLFGATTHADNNDYVPFSLKKLTVTGDHEIFGGACFDCLFLEEIIIQDSVPSIECGAFQMIEDVDNYITSNLKSITLPFIGSELNSTDTYFLGYIFGSQKVDVHQLYVPSGLTTVKITGSMENLPSKAFYECSTISEIYLNDGLVSIGDYCFKGTSITSISIPSSVSTINDTAFIGAELLNDITFTGTTFVFESGILFNQDKTKILFIKSNLTGVLTIPNTITEIVENQFSNLKLVTEIVIPQNVTYIDSSAFFGCDLLELITVSSSNQEYTSVNGVLYNKDKTNIISIPLNYKQSLIFEDSITSFDYDLFLYITKITSLEFKKSVEQISIEGLGLLTELTSIEVSSENTKYYTQDGILYNYEKTEILFVPYKVAGEVTIPEGITEIPKSSFKLRNQITEINLPSTLEVINEEAFYNCTLLSQINFPTNLVEIGRYSFFACTSLEEITLNGNLEEITDYSFASCTGLKIVNLSSGLGYLSKTAFDSSMNIHTLTLASSNEDFIVQNNILYEVIKYTTIDPIQGEVLVTDYEFAYIPYAIQGEITVLTGIDSILIASSDNLSITFIDRAKITKVILPEGVTSIGNNAFTRCSSLTEIVFPSTLKEIGSSAFFSCTSLVNTNLEDTQVSKIGTQAFAYCYNLEIIIPTSVVQIETSAFKNTERTSLEERAKIYLMFTESTIPSGWHELWMGTSVNNRENSNYYYYSETEPTTDKTSYWHYVGEAPTIWE